MLEKIKRQVEQLEESMGAHDDVPRINIRIVWVSPDGSESAPMTLEELQRRDRERRQSSPSADTALSEGGYRLVQPDPSLGLLPRAEPRGTCEENRPASRSSWRTSARSPRSRAVLLQSSRAGRRAPRATLPGQSASASRRCLKCWRVLPCGVRDECNPFLARNWQVCLKIARPATGAFFLRSDVR
jgi:hypothetical protein